MTEELFEQIYDAGLKFLEPQTPQETYETIVTQLIKLVGGTYGTILLEENGALERKFATSDEIYDYSARRRGSAYNVYKTNQARILDISESISAHPHLVGRDLSSSLIVPLSYQNKVIGVIQIYATDTKVFTERDLEVGRFFSPLATLAITKSQAFEQVKDALDKRDLFISMASHELKTPLTSVYAYLQLMHFKIQRGETFDAKWIERIIYEVEHLTKLVGELLQIKQVQTGQLVYHKKACRLHDIVDRAIKNFSYNHPEYLVHVESVQTGDAIMGDYDKLLQVFMNILNNAAKFSPKDSIITVATTMTDTSASVSIIDRGQGIDKQDLPKIFEGYYKGDNSSHEGMGLGLYLAKQIVDEHDGTITVRSKIGEGTAFIISLPLIHHE